MEKKKKITLYIALAMLGVAAIVVIIALNVEKKDFFPEIPETTSDTTKMGEPKIITIEKDPEVDKRKAVRNSFQDHVSAEADGFNVSTFGGISGLKIKVRNTMAFGIDNIELQVRYMKAGGGVFKTETVYADNIKPNSSVVVDAPESSRGTEVKVNVVAVTSRALGLCYVSGKRGPDVEDPYLCN